MAWNPNREANSATPVTYFWKTVTVWSKRRWARYTPSVWASHGTMNPKTRAVTKSLIKIGLGRMWGFAECIATIGQNKTTLKEESMNHSPTTSHQMMNRRKTNYATAQSANLSIRSPSLK